ncbi:glutamate receptor-interacting protein 2-like isoform X3 [Scomber scombrus]|uniref:Glutamate receptor-interacting protein 2-like isoform X3 n=2 Tax=Scomber scombrus TaxID=13677 RepID=A0AAV1PER5_SCOSC
MPGWRRNLTFCLQRMHEEGASDAPIRLESMLAVMQVLAVLLQMLPPAGSHQPTQHSQYGCGVH